MGSRNKSRMYTKEFDGINSFLVGSCKLLLKEAQARDTRGHKCFELNGPYMFKIKNPCARHITIPERKWLKVLPYAESLWIASGRNDIYFINHYLNRMGNYSDNQETMRGGYGPRIRHFNGSSEDYDHRVISNESEKETDQFRYIVDCFKEDLNTRRAIIDLGDPMKDCFDSERKLKTTKDLPCTRTLQFVKQASSDKLDLIVSMRSNDLIYGASAVNIFNYTFMLEYFSSILGLEIGEYIHIANNMHYYEKFDELVRRIASIEAVEDVGEPLKKTFHSLHEFDELVAKLSKEEEKMRQDRHNYKEGEMQDSFFQHWYRVLYDYNMKRFKV